MHETRFARAFAWAFDAMAMTAVVSQTALEILSRVGPYASRTPEGCQGVDRHSWVAFMPLVLGVVAGVLVVPLAWILRWRPEGLFHRRPRVRFLFLASLLLVPVLGWLRLNHVREECRLQDLRADLQLVRSLVDRERTTLPGGVDEQRARANVLRNVEQAVCPRQRLPSGYEAVGIVRDRLHDQWVALRSEVADSFIPSGATDLPLFVRVGFRCKLNDKACERRFVADAAWSDCFPPVLAAPAAILPGAPAPHPTTADAGDTLSDGGPPYAPDASDGGPTLPPSTMPVGTAAVPANQSADAGTTTSTVASATGPDAPQPFHIDPSIEAMCVMGALAYAPAAAPYCSAARSVLESLLTYLANTFHMSSPDRQHLQRWLDVLARGMTSGSPAAGVLTILRETGNTGGIDSRVLDGFTFALGGIPPDMRAAMLPDGTLPQSGTALPLVAPSAYQSLQEEQESDDRRQYFADACTASLSSQSAVSASNSLRASIRQVCPNNGRYALSDPEHRAVLECVTQGSQLGPPRPDATRLLSPNRDQILRCVGALPPATAPAGRAPASVAVTGNFPTPVECARLLRYRDVTLRQAFDDTWLAHDGVAANRAGLVAAQTHWRQVASQGSTATAAELIDVHRYLYRQLRYVLDPLIAFYRGRYRPLIQRFVDVIRANNDAAANAAVDETTRRNASLQLERYLRAFGEISTGMAVSQQALEQLRTDRGRTAQLRQAIANASARVEEADRQLRVYDAAIRAARSDLALVGSLVGEVEAYIRQHCQPSPVAPTSTLP